MRTILLILLLCGSSLRVTPPQLVDKIEINTCRQTENSFYVQAIFWQIHEEDGEYHPAGWVIIDSDKFEPVKVGEYWYAKYRAFDNRVYSVRSKTLVRTETDYDPERYDKKVFDEKRRKNLIGQ
jgi:acyl-ACP thioesterase